MSDSLDIFFDAHLHAMSISHPNFAAFMHEIESNFSEEVVSGMFSPNYLLNYKGSTAFLARVQNLMAVVERSIGEIFILMEQDLSTRFDQFPSWSLLPKSSEKRPYDPFIADGHFHFRSRTYDRIGLCPMIMDFTQIEQIDHGVYTHTHSEDRLITYIDDTLEGIDYYRRISPHGIFEFFPFMGINPAAHDLSFIKDLIATYMITDLDERKRCSVPLPGSKRFCFGIKLYPPLGFDPWPKDDEQEMEKVRYLYDYCVRHRIPITTHCDDQGFRTIGAKRAWEFSAPRTWEHVLREYPDLIIDFAHFGKQYRPVSQMASKAQNLIMPVRLMTQVSENNWFTGIIDLMLNYEHVYADFSFSGCTAAFYKQLIEYIENLSEEDQRIIISRSMFGSDFFVNLSKIDSYSHFFKLYELSAFSDDQIHRMASENVRSWLQLDQACLMTQQE